MLCDLFNKGGFFIYYVLKRKFIENERHTPVVFIFFIFNCVEKHIITKYRISFCVNREKVRTIIIKLYRRNFFDLIIIFFNKLMHHQNSFLFFRMFVIFFDTRSNEEKLVSNQNGLGLTISQLRWLRDVNSLCLFLIFVEKIIDKL